MDEKYIEAGSNMISDYYGRNSIRENNARVARPMNRIEAAEASYIGAVAALEQAHLLK